MKRETKLKAMMQSRGFSQKDLREFLHVSQPMASLLMAGKRKLSFQQALRLAVKLECIPESIYGFIESSEEVEAAVSA